MTVILPSVSDKYFLTPFLMTEDAILGCLLGTAVGDALGLPYEGLSPRRAQRIQGPPTRYRFAFGRGMVSDDTELSCLVAQALIESGNDLNRFVDSFAQRLRRWIVLFPAGVGKATAKSCLNLCMGAAPSDSGVDSAGNGPAMRAAIFGAAVDDSAQMIQFVNASTQITHSDPQAEYGALAIALAARESRLYQQLDIDRYMDRVVDAIGPEGGELTRRLEIVVRSVKNQETTMQYAENNGLRKGVSGYTYHSVPAVIHAWMSHPRDFLQAVQNVIACGGDADTTAAMVGGIVGSGVGRKGIDSSLVHGLAEWPRDVDWIQALAEMLEDCIENETRAAPPEVNSVAVAIRNLGFRGLVMFHGFRRLLPPY